MSIIKIVTLSLSLSLFSFHTPLLVAQDSPTNGRLKVPVGQQGNQSTAIPRRGTSQEKVKEQFGEPSNTVSSIGEPPISVWYYGDFTVYFESKKVIHSVLKAQN